MRGWIAQNSHTIPCFVHMYDGCRDCDHSVLIAMITPELEMVFNRTFVIRNQLIVDFLHPVVLALLGRWHSTRDENWKLNVSTLR